MKLSKIVCASLLSFCASNLLFAETNSDITHDVIGYEESAYGAVDGYVAKKSSTGSKMDVDLNEIPQSISVITKDMMDTRNVQTIQNVTAYTASIVQPYGENGDTRTNYGRIRGLSYLYKSTFLDGLKLLYAGHLIPKVDPYALERVEVLKGPASVLYGAAGPGGLLNLQSKKPTLEPHKEVGISYGSFNNKTIKADISDKINDQVLFRLTGKHKKGDNELDRSTNESYFFNPSLTYFLDDDTTLDFYASVAKDQINGLGMTYGGAKSVINYHNSIIAAGGAGVNPTLPTQAAEINNANLSTSMMIGLPDQEVFEKEHKSIGVNLTKILTDDLKLKSNVRYMQMDGIFNYSRPDSARLASLYVDLSNIPFTYNEQTSELATFAIDNNLEYNWGNETVENTSLLGVDFQYLDFDRQVKSPVAYNFDVLAPDYNQRVASSNTLSQDYNTKSKQVGVYLQNHAKINDAFIISSSLRYDKLKETTNNHLNNTSASQTDDNVSGRLGFVYKFDNGVSPYITYSTSFQGNIGSDRNGNKFKPSVGKQIEIGTRYEPENMNALFTIAAFKIEEKDRLNTDPADTSYQIQQGDVEIKGIEFDAVFNPIEDSNIVFSIAKLTGKEVNMANPDYEGREQGDLPDLTASLWSDYTFRNTTIGNVKVGAGVKYIGNAKSLNTDYLGGGSKQVLEDVDSYTIADALIATEYKGLTLALNAYNIFDKEARLNNNQIQSGITQGRTFTFSATYKF